LNSTNNAGQGADSTRPYTVTNGNASVAAEASKLKIHTTNVAEDIAVRERFKRSIFGAISQVGDDGAENVTDDTPDNGFLLDDETEALIDQLTATGSSSLRYKLRTGADLFNEPPMSWLLQGVLPLEGLAALYGPSGCGKSFLTLGLGCAVAGGVPAWFGRRITQAPVTYVCLEGEAGMGKRVKAWSVYEDKPPPNALHFITQSFDLLIPSNICDLANAVIAGGGDGGMVILDTLNRAAPGADENSSVDMGKLIAAAKNLQVLLGGLVLLVHHTGKDATRGMRGHSSLYAALDAAVEVSNTGNRSVWSVAKSKDDVTGEAHQFMLETVPVDIDDEGKEIKSCVIVPDQSAQARQQKVPTLGRNQFIAHKALEDLLSKSVDIDKDGAPQGRQCIRFDEALEIVAPLIKVQAKHQRQRAKEALAGLVSNGVIGMKGDWLWGNQTYQS
jgi:putative DNA primase/helicase